MSEAFDPAHVSAIQANSADVRHAADELTRRIKTFEAWLSRLPGRVESSCLIYEDEARGVVATLALERDGKEWALYFQESEVGSDRVISSTLLRDAAVITKSLAVRRFPELLAAIPKQQKLIVSMANDSVKEFDVFAKSIGLKEVE